MTARTAPSSNFPAVAVLVWLGIAIAVGATGVMAQLRSPVPQLVIVGLGVATVFAGRRNATLRDWIARADLRWLVAPHLGRLVAGLVFFAVASPTGLSPVFARNAGSGDIAVALLAIPLLLWGPPTTQPRRVAYLVWNALGVADFVMVFATAATVARSNPGAMAPLFHLPLAVIPMFGVPLMIAAHVFIFRRLLLERAK